MASHAYEFLEEPFVGAFEPPAPVNVFTLTGTARVEPVASTVLAFLLDPNERHRFGTTFVDALVTLLDGAATERGPFDAGRCAGSSEWSVTTETRAGVGDRVDVLLENEHLDVAIVVTTGAEPGSDERGRQLARIRDVRATVVEATIARARTRPDLATDATHRIHSLAYDDLFDAADAALYDVGPVAEQRSLELYAQFRESMSERIARMTIEHEQRRLDELWSAIGQRQDQVLDFFTALDAANAVLVARATRLRRAIDERLHAAGAPHSSSIVNAGDHAWGRSRGERALVYLGFAPSTGGAIELLVGWLPRTGTFGYAVHAHRERERPPRTWDHIPLGLPFDADEDAVADRFAHLALRWAAGERPD
ncbi:PD-(D/E)XK nuclease family protein [Agrococcus sp. SGAir0287]|uniref:PD-(D/E)XK nuclease family protein n=1 Tax=Agrococcus sp. SGAir0287 TaxID=2070347 RepID=UPI0010CD2F5F|nr:PD-(D/E)XK nuclease family protein [Agrococcus sp. SGAir0287]QCR20295.1 hypothetical protein C1N71_13310 [Agrococcus sp. SGAir0287]